MRTLAPWTEQFQHFTNEVRDQFWGDLYRHTRELWQRSVERLWSRRGIGIWASASMNGRPAGRIRATGSMSGTWSRSSGLCACAWPGRGGRPSCRGGSNVCSGGPRK